jgi:outer membrane usher protein
VRLGDGVTRGGLGGAPARFGGVQWATDFSLDPGFIFYPTPSLHGEAATPSTVDVYIDGALRARHDAEAGPFSISDAPVITGAGVAELVVTDVLGRQQRFAQPFYASAAMLRPGLSDYSLALGALRENFGSDSFSYGGWMVSALERRGMTRNLTLEARLDAEDDLAVLSAGASFANHRTGQIDVALAQGAGESSGALTRIAWSRQSQNLAFNADLQNADAHFRRPGEDHAPPRLQASASASVNLGRAGAGSVAYVAQDWRDIGGVETLAFTYQPPALGAGRFDLSAFYVDSATAALRKS